MWLSPLLTRASSRQSNTPADLGMVRGLLPRTLSPVQLEHLPHVVRDTTSTCPTLVRVVTRFDSAAGHFRP